VRRKGNESLLHQWHPSCYSSWFCVPVMRRFIRVYLFNSFYHVIVASGNYLWNKNKFSVKKLYFKPHSHSFYRKQINSPLSHICFVCKQINSPLRHICFVCKQINSPLRHICFVCKQINSPLSHICFVCKQVNLMVSNLSFFFSFFSNIWICWLSDCELMGAKFLKVHFTLIQIFGFKHITLLVISLILV
jgi:hypothetical protein